ncbi:hypothetical protein SDC9_93698 [bioreactor metagenome]|uniref:Uncharacterized protein n=1 Tax=bioreactor metagenome TaxID=1076179 RepID=A0A645A404_9ZZZZ
MTHGWSHGKNSCGKGIRQLCSAGSRLPVMAIPWSPGSMDICGMVAMAMVTEGFFFVNGLQTQRQCTCWQRLTDGKGMKGSGSTAWRVAIGSCTFRRGYWTTECFTNGWYVGMEERERGFLLMPGGWYRILIQRFSVLRFGIRHPTSGKANFHHRSSIQSYMKLI